MQSHVYVDAKTFFVFECGKMSTNIADSRGQVDVPHWQAS